MPHAGFIVLPVIVTAFALYYAIKGGYDAGDFRHTFLISAWRALHGGDPYSWTRAQVAAQLSFPYPALVVVLLMPLTLLPAHLAGILCIVAYLAGTLIALRVLSVRDWRLYGLVLLWSPVVISWQTGNFTIPLVLLSALVWRHRDHPVAAGLLAALAISIKPIMFPLGLWLLATRRYKAAGYTAGAGVAANALAFTVIGWAEFGRWLHLLSVQSQVMYRDGYGIIAFVGRLGAGRPASTAVAAAVACGLAAVCIVQGRRGRDRVAFTLAVALTLIASPKIDDHYFAVLAVPLAVILPRLSWPWLVPLLLWLCPATGPAEWQIAVWWLAAAVLIGTTLRRSPSPTLQADGRFGEAPVSHSPAAPAVGALVV